MKKLITLILTLALSVMACFGLTACGEQLNFGKSILKLDSQLDTLNNLSNGSADVAVIDSVMAGYYTRTGSYAETMQIVDGLVLAEEDYGIAGRKNDQSLISKINEALIDIRTTGYIETATQFGVQESICITETTTNPLASTTDNSWNNIVTSKTLIIGYTVFAPIAYTENNTFTGFDIELAKKVVAYLNTKYSTEITVQFQEIDWDSKEALLANGTIDLVWNGMTITPERQANMCISVPYLKNKQVAVIRKADATKYVDTASMAEAIIAVESGSAGESVVVKK